MNDPAELRKIFNRMEARKIFDEQQLLERIKEQWQKSGCITELNTLREIGYSSPKFYDHVLRTHPAKELSDNIDNIDQAFEILKFSYNAIIDLIGKFHSEILYGAIGDVDLKRTQSEATRAVYTYSCASVSLVQAYRHLFSGNEERKQKYESAKAEILTEIGIIKFVSDLRRHNNHLLIQTPAPHYKISWSEGRQVTSGMRFNAEQILKNKKNWSPESRKMAEENSTLELSYIFEKHFSMADQLRKNVLFRTGINQDVLYRDFRRIKVARKTIAKIVTLGLILQVALSKKADPYPYLKNHFTKQELENIYCLPDHSKEQVDYMISLYDTLELCDESTRTSLYKLFGVTPTISK